MDYLQYKEVIKDIKIGKQLPDATYVHDSALSTIPEPILELIQNVAKALKIKDEEWNIVKLYKRDFKIALLAYPGFEDDSYPALHTSQTIDLQKLSVRKADYSKSENPPILHRKETFIEDNHPLKAMFEDITAEGEAVGLYENTRKIGFKQGWHKLIASKGHYLDNKGRLQCLIDKPEHDEGPLIAEGTIDRHKTAIDRNQLSQPMQILARHNYLNDDLSVLDYGCGKGDDVRELEAHGLNVSGWDPVHNPEGELLNSDIVNLGFVLNVIEERSERDETLKRAWGYADKLMVVSAMVAGEATICQFKPYKDGVITSRNTFQRYYTQAEFRSYIESTLNESAIAVGQGIFIVFKDPLEEQHFLLERQHIRRNWRQLSERQRRTPPTAINKDLIEKHQELFDDFWNTTLDLGRIPANNEFEHSEQIRRVAGSHNKALQALLKQQGEELFKRSQQAREHDLMVYFALGLFEKRKAYKHMPEGLKRDIKAFYSNHKQALEAATQSLFSVGNPTLIEEAAIESYQQLKHGEFNERHSWIIHKDKLSELPAELRIYVGCATQLYGDLESIQLIKIHFTSGKVSLMGYDDWSLDIPHLVERIKIKLREQDIDFFDYNEKFTPPPLINKDQFTLQ